MQQAAAYLRQGAVHIHSSSETESGYWIAIAPFVTASLDAPTLLGESTRNAIDASESGIPDPEVGCNLLAPLYLAANVKKWSSFSRNAKCLLIQRDADHILLIPQRNLGGAAGFEPFEAVAVCLASSASDQEIGAGMTVAFQRCE